HVTVACPLPPAAVTREGAPGSESTLASAASASRYPPPTALALPCVATGRAVLERAAMTCAVVSAGAFSRSSAPIAAAWGAAADVPAKRQTPLTCSAKKLVCTSSVGAHAGRVNTSGGPQALWLAARAAA